MKKRDFAAASAAVSDKRRKKKKIRAAAITAAVAVSVALCLVLINFCYFPLGYLWVKFSNPKIAARREGDLRVHFVDVGQGDAIIAELPDGKTMLIDGGVGDYDSKSALLRYINALGISKFDYLMLTHPDADHAGGLDDVLRCFGAEKAFIPYVTEYDEDSAYGQFLDELSKIDCDVKVSCTYQTILSDTSEFFYYMMILSPFQQGIDGSYYEAANAQGATDEDQNAASAVLWLEYAGRRILFTGDITSEVEEDLCEQYETLGEECFLLQAETIWGEQVTLTPEPDKLDFLKVAHHGSASSTSERFLQLTTPEAAFISVGVGNMYNHPSQETLKRLYDAGTDVYRTDELGSVILTIDQEGGYAVDHIGRA